MQRRPAPIAALVAALLPLTGVLLLGWSVESMFGLYWAETVVVGLFHWLTLLAARGAIDDPQLARALAEDPHLTATDREQRLETDRRRQRQWLPMFAVAFYSLFFAAHAGAIVVLFDGAFVQLASVLGFATLIAMALQPALEYYRFRADSELRGLPASVLFFQQFKRVGVMQLALLLGAIPVNAGYPLAAALVLTALKVVVELSGGWWRASKRPRSAEPSR